MPGTSAHPLPPAFQPAAFQPGAGLPLAGVTILTVEDSRYASEALRLLCHRSGARLQRTDSLAGAERHLAMYRPDVVIVDLGLPDGPGTALIARLARGYGGFRGAILAMSGDPSGRDAALTAGAAAFLEKPVLRLAAFQATVLRTLSRAAAAPGADADIVVPDPQALSDDLRHAARLAQGTTPAAYLAAFVQSFARASGDRALETVARAMGATGESGRTRLHRALTRRLERAPDAFAPGPRNGG